MSRPVVVVGGGLSGLVVAYRLAQQSVPVVIVEARARTGGVLVCGRVGGRGGPMLDLGAEAMLARRREGVELATELGLADDLVTPAVGTAAIWRSGRLHAMPRTLMGVPGEVRTLNGLLNTDELADLRARGMAPGRPLGPDDVTVGDWVAQRLGTAVRDRLVEPLLAGVYAGSVQRLSLRATLPQLGTIAESGQPVLPAVAQLLDRAAHVPAGSPVFVGIRGGVARLTQRLTEWLAAGDVEIRTATCVTSLLRTGAGWRVGTRRSGDRSALARTGLSGLDESIDASGVVLAVPAPAAARLLAGASTHHRLLAETFRAAEILGRVEVASIGLVSLLLPPGALDAVGRWSGVLVPSVEGRSVKAMTFSSRKWAWVGQAAGGGDVLRLSLGRRGETAALARGDGQLVEVALADASEILGVALSPSAWRVNRWGGGLPQYDVGHLRAVAAVRESIRAVDGLELAGAVFDGVGIPACIATATAAAQRLIDTSG